MEEHKPGPMVLSRRAMLAGSAALVAAREAPIALGEQERLRLWPAEPPGGPVGLVTPHIETSRDGTLTNRTIRGVATPELIVFRASRPNGGAALIAPGGGYAYVSYDNEGVEQAAWLNALGITAFVLLYRLPGEGWRDRADVPLQDAQRAMRLIRARARDYAVDPQRVLALGFSAGGHLMGSLATRHAEPTYAPIDRADTLAARPDLAALIYSVVTFAPEWTHGGSSANLLGPGANARMTARYSVETRVDAATPPTFLAHANDDPVVPAQNAILLYQAMRRSKRPIEMHLFATGGHAWGVRLPKTEPASAWPELMTRFARAQGVWPA